MVRVAAGPTPLASQAVAELAREPGEPSSSRAEAAGDHPCSRSGLPAGAGLALWAWVVLIGLSSILTIAVVADPASSGRILAGEVHGVPEAEAREADAEPELPNAFDAGWKGEPVCEVLQDTEAVRIARCSFPPGVGHEKHFHRPHFGYVLTGGTMRIEDADGVETVETRAGATWTSDETSVHEVVNVGDTTTSYLIVEPKTP